MSLQQARTGNKLYRFYVFIEGWLLFIKKLIVFSDNYDIVGLNDFSNLNTISISKLRNYSLVNKFLQYILHVYITRCSKLR